MDRRSYDALVLDIDGTLLDEQERIHPHTRAALQGAQAAGVKVMLATGRSHGGTRDLALELALETPSVVFNGAGVYCAAEDQLIELTTLSESTVKALLIHARGEGLLAVVARSDGQFSRAAQTEAEARALASFRQCRIVDESILPHDGAIRVTLLSSQHLDSFSLCATVQRAVPDPAYLTHFPLAALPRFRDSSMQVLDVHPECAGKAEAFRVLAERYRIVAERVVAVGDASNDLPMLRRAGLAVAMGNASDDAKQAAHRVIGDNDSDAIGALIEEVF